jgi:hypothetical protein
MIYMWFTGINYYTDLWENCDSTFMTVMTIWKPGFMHESIPGVTIPPPEHTWECDMIGYDSANAGVQGHN